MSGRPWLPVAVWGVFLTGLTGLFFAFPLDVLSVVLLGSAALTTVLLAAVVALAVRDETRDAEVAEPIPDLSLSVLALAAGLCFAVVGAQVGLWLILIGAGVVSLGVGGLVRELRAERPARTAEAPAAREGS